MTGEGARRSADPFSYCHLDRWRKRFAFCRILEADEGPVEQAVDAGGEQ